MFMNIQSKEQAQKLITAYLRKAATAHHSGDFGGIAEGFAEMDNSLPRARGPEWDDIFIALDFWYGWIDASNHEWRYYTPMGIDDWPKLAEGITADLESGREIGNDIVLKMFGPEEENKVTFWQKVKCFFQ